MPIELAKPFRLIGWGLLGVAALTLGVLILIIVTGEGTYEPGAFIIPAGFGAAGYGFRYAAARIDGKDGPEAVVIGSWVFKTVGILCMIGGLLLAFTDPGGLALIPFGAVFFGAGHMMKKLFATPEGKKRVLIPQHAVSYRTDRGTQARQSSSAVIYVDEDADDAEIEAAKAAWQAERVSQREDWASGRILEEGARTGHWRKWGAALWSIVFLAFLVAAILVGEFALWLCVAGSAFFAGGFSYVAIREHLHARKFSESRFVTQLPARLGTRLEGEIETGVALRQNPRTGFTLTLECEHRWEESHGHGEDRETRPRSKTLWKDKKHERGAMRAGTPGLILPVSFDLPQDGQPSSLGIINEGIHWRLTASAEMEGLDYSARFIVPVAAGPEADTRRQS